jgi:hypothetical protein
MAKERDWMKDPGKGWLKATEMAHTMAMDTGTDYWKAKDGDWRKVQARVACGQKLHLWSNKLPLTPANLKQLISSSFAPSPVLFPFKIVSSQIQKIKPLRPRLSIRRARFCFPLADWMSKN